MSNIQQTNVVVRGDSWFMQQSYIDGTYIFEKKVPNVHKKKVAQLYYEYELIQKLQLEMMLPPTQIRRDELYTTMHYELKDPFVPLTQLLGKPLPVTSFLKIAIQITNCFIELHQVSHIYQNIHPHHIFINKLNNIVKFINFEETFKYTTQHVLLKQDVDVPVHRTLYLAPEETGRVNSQVDFQTDLYAIGAIFYELLTGRPLYDGSPHTVLYELLTKEPLSFRELGIDVPVIVEKIIFKLLSKDKEQRYQSAIGVKEDLSICWYHLTNNLPLNHFQLAQFDEQGKWQLSHVNPTSKQLVAALVDNIAQEQKVQIVTGATSSGKTFLLQQVENYYTNQNISSYYVKRATEQDTLQVPAIFITLRKKLQQLLQNNQTELFNARSSWPSFIPSSIVYFLPELRTLITEMKFSEEQEYIEQYQLFQILFQIIEYLNMQSVEVYFLVDDYEALDEFTRQFLQFTMTQYSHNRFIFTAMHERDIVGNLPEVDYVHFHMELLSKAQIYDWLSMSLKEDSIAIEQCAALLHDVSNGIPLYVTTFFNDFCDLQILKFNIVEAKWEFDISNIHALDLTNYNIFINEALENVNEEQLLLIAYATGLGTRFDVVQLFDIAPFTHEQTLQLFLQLIEKRVFIILPEQFSMLELIVDLNMLQEFDIFAQFFNDDMYRQAKMRVSAEHSQQIHANIVDSLRHKELETEDEKRFLWHHLKIIETQLTAEQLLTYLTLSLELGNMTLKSAVFHEGLHFGEVFASVMPTSYWTMHYELALQGSILYANALYLNDFIDEALPLFEMTLTRAKSVEDQLVVYNETILFLTFSQVEVPVQPRLQYITNITKKALALLTITMPTQNYTYHIAKEYVKLKATVHKKTNEQLLAKSKITDNRIDLALQIIMNSSGVLLIHDEKLYVWSILKGMNLLQKYGDQVYSSFFYGSYSNILAIAFKDYKNSYRFGRLSIIHLEAYDNILFKGNVYMNFGGSISFLKDSYETAIYYLYQTQRFSIPNTLHDLYNSTAAAYMLVCMNLQSVPLSHIKLTYEEQRPYLLATNNPIAHLYSLELLYWIEVLQSEHTRIDWDRPVSNRTRVSYWESHLILRLQMSYLLYEMDEGLRLIAEIEQSIEQVPTRPELPHYYFYKALTLFRQYDNAIDISTRAAALKEISVCCKRLKKFVDVGPTNHEHLLTLLEAMKYQRVQQHDKAKLYFDRAIQLARHNENSRDEAIAQMNAAVLYDHLQEPLKAANYMQRALQLFYRWGAPYVVTILTAQYYDILQEKQLMTQDESTKSFNVAPIVNLYQHIAQDEHVEQLANAALTEMLQQMDATEIHLIKVNVDEFYPLASMSSESESFHYYEQRSSYLPKNVDAAILQQVIDSKSYVVLNDVQSGQKSVIALAIFNKGQITAIVYAVNYVMSAIFTTSKIDMVTILATQFLVALENYERQHELELIVEKRTEELSQVNAQLQQMNAQLLQSEQERKYFLQHISHDLRSPLTSVLGYIEAIQSGMVPSVEKQQQYLTRSKTRLLSLQHLIKDLFDMTQLEGSQLQLRLEQMTVEQLVVYIEELMEYELASETLSFKSEIFIPEETLYVQVDIERMLQVFQNFASNILKYANEGIVTLHFMVVQEQLIMTVTDQGIGIPYHDVPFVFDMHYVGSNHSRKDSYGIGMTICKRIIDLHDGLIDVASTEGKGTTFTITLPVQFE